MKKCETERPSFKVHRTCENFKMNTFIGKNVYHGDCFSYTFRFTLSNEYTISSGMLFINDS